MGVGGGGHIPDVLTYMSRLHNQSIFNFCAIPQVCVGGRGGGGGGWVGVDGWMGDWDVRGWWLGGGVHHIPDVLTYMSRLHNQSIFNFCAIPQVCGRGVVCGQVSHSIEKHGNKSCHGKRATK